LRTITERYAVGAGRRTGRTSAADVAGEVAVRTTSQTHAVAVIKARTAGCAVVEGTAVAGRTSRRAGSAVVLEVVLAGNCLGVVALRTGCLASAVEENSSLDAHLATGLVLAPETSWRAVEADAAHVEGAIRAA
jgi:hypothetical protein